MRAVNLGDGPRFALRSEQGAFPRFQGVTDLDFWSLDDAEFEVALQSLGDLPTGGVEGVAPVFPVWIDADYPERAAAPSVRAARAGAHAFGLQLVFAGLEVAWVDGKHSTARVRYAKISNSSNYLITLPMASPIDIRIILPIVFKLKTIIGSLLSRHMAIEVASITPRVRDSTSR